MTLTYVPTDEQSVGELTFFADFENASANFEARHEDGSYHVSPYSWMHFGVRGTAGRRPTFRVDRPDHLDERRKLVWSTNGRDWSYFDHADAEGEYYSFANEKSFDTDRVYIAGLFPYRLSDLERLLRELEDHRFVRDLGPRGYTPNRRPIHGLAVTDPNVPEEKKRTVVSMAGQHAWEAWGRHVLHGLLEAAVSDDPAAARLRRNAVVYAYPMANPDGVTLGHMRDTTADHNPNRAWEFGAPPNGDQSPVPEVDVLRRAIVGDTDSEAAYLLDFHSHAGWYDRFMWYADGDDPEVVELVEAVHRADSERNEDAIVGTEVVGGSPDPERKTSKLWGTRTLGATSLTMEATPYGTPSISRYRRAGRAFVAGLSEVFDSGEKR